jgi:hypothetical protein
MLSILRLLATFVADLFKSRRRLEAEILCLRHQLNIALRRRPARLPLRRSDRALLVWMTRLWPSHVPGQRYYDKTQIDESRGERWFCTEQEAVGADWRKANV